MKVREIMTATPACCTPDATASHAAQMMKEQDTGIIPIVESEYSRKVIGVVTDRDLCLMVVAEGRNPESVTVKEVMTSDVIACRPDADVEKAVALMRENRIRRIPVLDADWMILGIVSMADLLQRSDLPSGETHQTMKKVTEPTQGTGHQIKEKIA
jgi:CBS domain-containing protein